MAALTAVAKRAERAAEQKRINRYAVGTGAVIYQGGIVAMNVSTGRAVAATAAASRVCLGIAEETATGNTGGTVYCDVAYNHEVLINAATALTVAYMRADVCVSTDNDVTSGSDAGTAGVQVAVGSFTELESGDAWVHVMNISGRRAQTY